MTKFWENNSLSIFGITNLTKGLSKTNYRNPHVEVRFILRLMLCFPPILAWTKSYLDQFHRLSTWGFL